MAPRSVDAIPGRGIVVAALSFVFPGLGHVVLGAFRRGLLLAGPMLVLVAVGIGAVATQGAPRLVGIVLQPDVLVALLVVNVAVLLWRSVAMLDAFRIANRGAPAGGLGGRLLAGAVLAALFLTTVGMHVGLGAIGIKTYDTVAHIFVTPEPSPPQISTPLPTVAPTMAGASAVAAPTLSTQPSPSPTPVPSWSSDGRLDLLLVGGDAGPGRWSLRTDTMILLSVDLASGRAALFGIPRNLENVPLPEGPAAAFPGCNCYPDLLNSLYVFAGAHPELFRGGEQRGYLALRDAVAELVARPLDGMVVVTLQGFVRLVDAVGGLDIQTPADLYDATYPLEDGTGSVELWIPAGQHHFDGHMALAYARSRHQDSDYGRMDRQQLVLTALRSQICPSDLVLRIPELLDIARDSMWTNVPIGQLPDILALGSRVGANEIASYQFWPPQIPETLGVEGLARLRRMVSRAFVAPPAPSPGASTPVTADPC